jgi:hypothetical protein
MDQKRLAQLLRKRAALEKSSGRFAQAKVAELDAVLTAEGYESAEAAQETLTPKEKPAEDKPAESDAAPRGRGRPPKQEA